jgi:hypothetical protein
MGSHRFMSRSETFAISSCQQNQHSYVGKTEGGGCLRLDCLVCLSSKDKGNVHPPTLKGAAADSKYCLRRAQSEGIYESYPTFMFKRSGLRRRKFFSHALYSILVRSSFCRCLNSLLLRNSCQKWFMRIYKIP